MYAISIIIPEVYVIYDRKRFTAVALITRGLLPQQLRGPLVSFTKERAVTVGSGLARETRTPAATKAGSPSTRFKLHSFSVAARSLEVLVEEERER
jgi:hypothetical protein